MKITNVEIVLCRNQIGKHKAMAHVTFDECLRVPNFRVIQRDFGGLFVSMPDKLKMARCPDCRHRNELRANFCSACGKSLQFLIDTSGPGRTYYDDTIKPTTPTFYRDIQMAVITAYLEVCPTSYKGSEDPFVTTAIRTPHERVLVRAG